jgi:predicted HAD superfamily Cof-like phosphohydrolase
MNTEYEQVREFHERFGHPIAYVPKTLEEERVNSRGKWMLEELAEFFEAADICEQADAIIDLMYFAIGTFVEMGLPPDELFKVVHEANMTKLWADGIPRYDEDGKTLKPDGWTDPAPRLKAAIAAMQQQ